MAVHGSNKRKTEQAENVFLPLFITKKDHSLQDIISSKKPIQIAQNKPLKFV